LLRVSTNIVRVVAMTVRRKTMSLEEEGGEEDKLASKNAVDDEDDSVGTFKPVALRCLEISAKLLATLPEDGAVSTTWMS